MTSGDTLVMHPENRSQGELTAVAGAGNRTLTPRFRGRGCGWPLMPRSAPAGRVIAMTTMIRTSLTALAIAASITVAACGGSGVDNDEADKIRDHATQVQEDAQRTADEVRAGTKDAEEAAKEIQQDATDLANETIDAAKDADIPDEAKEQLDEAQAQLNEAAGN